MGFGIMFANSAIVARHGGCGGCGGGQYPVREVYLSQDEVLYALAVFCQLKSIESKKVTKHLKKHLRGFFKAAMKDSQRRLSHRKLLENVVNTIYFLSQKCRTCLFIGGRTSRVIVVN